MCTVHQPSKSFTATHRHGCMWPNTNHWVSERIPTPLPNPETALLSPTQSASLTIRGLYVDRSMAFSNPLSGRMEELRFPNLRSPDTEVFSPNSTAVRDQNSYFAYPQNSSNDARASLQRRFTTDSSKMSASRPFGQQYSSMNSTAVRGLFFVILKD